MEAIKEAGLAVRVGAFTRLSQRYQKKHGELGQALARAVVDRLFSDKTHPVFPAAKLAEERPDLIEEELSALRDDPELVSMAWATVSEEMPVRWACGATMQEIDATFDRLVRHGLPEPEVGVSTEEFLAMAQRFFESNRS